MSRVRILLRVHNLKMSNKKQGNYSKILFLKKSTYLIFHVSAGIKAPCHGLYCLLVTFTKEKGNVFIVLKLFNIRTNFNT